MDAPQDNLRASRGIVMAVGCSLVFWAVVIVVLLVIHRVHR